MDRLAVLLVAVVPALCVFAYGIVKTRSSWGNEALWTAFLLGATGAVAVLILGAGTSFLPDRLGLTGISLAAWKAVFGAAIPEEGVKFLMVVGVAERHVDARRLQDVIALALAVSLGFAAMENLVFIAIPLDWHMIAASRAISSVPAHGVDGIAMGALITLARLSTDHRKLWLAAALVVPTAMHAAYDFPLFLHSEYKANATLLVWLPILILITIIALALCNWALPKAALADRATGTDSASSGNTKFLMGGGVLMVIASILLGVASGYIAGVQIVSVGATLAVIPTMLGADMIWSAWRRRRDAEPVPGP